MRRSGSTDLKRAVIFMNGFTGLRVALLLTVCATTWPTTAAAQTPAVPPSPLSLGDIIRLAGERRDEIQAAWARVLLTLVVLPAAYAMWRRHQVRVSTAVSVPQGAVTTSAGAA